MLEGERPQNNMALNLYRSERIRGGLSACTSIVVIFGIPRREKLMLSGQSYNQRSQKIRSLGML